MPLNLLAKQKGEWAEVCFAAEVLRRGWRISRPYGDSGPYDCIVDVRGRISRVQVKAVAQARKKTRFPYVVKLIRGRFNHLSYSGREIDVIAVLIVPKSVWYIVPISAVEGWRPRSKAIDRGWPWANATRSALKPNKWSCSWKA